VTLRWSRIIVDGLLAVASHNHVRTSAGLFDVSHMIQQTFRGPSAQAFLSHLCPTSLASLQPYTSSLSVLLNESGGIIDDMIVTKHANDNEFYVVTNAGRAKEDGEWFAKQLSEWNATKGKGKEVEWNKLEGYGLVALQGKSINIQLPSR
jgi:aminomethyltransferase